MTTNTKPPRGGANGLGMFAGNAQRRVPIGPPRSGLRSSPRGVRGDISGADPPEALADRDVHGPFEDEGVAPQRRDVDIRDDPDLGIEPQETHPSPAPIHPLRRARAPPRSPCDGQRDRGPPPHRPDHTDQLSEGLFPHRREIDDLRHCPAPIGEPRREHPVVRSLTTRASA